MEHAPYPYKEEDLEVLWECFGLDQSDIEDMRDGNPTRFDVLKEDEQTTN